MNKLIIMQSIVGVIAIILAGTVIIYIVSFLVFCVDFYIDSYASFKGAIG